MLERGENPFGRVRKIHFVGIGGSGMSGLAEVMHNLGYEVSGSDISENTETRRLAGLGVEIAQSHDGGLVAAVDVVVTSSAIGAENPEVMEARRLRVPVVPRAEMLSEVMRLRYGIAIAGTHGKTTTTSLVAHLLAEAGLDPTFVIGGRLNSTGAHAKLGAGRYLVAEADESDASFLRLQPVIAVVTNIDADHLGAYGGDFSQLRTAFVSFLQRLPLDGLAVLCIDDVVIRQIIPELSRPYLTYGTDPEADVRATAISQFQGVTEFTVTGQVGREPLVVSLNLPGRHNVLNALAAISIAQELGADAATVKSGLLSFQGIARRLQCIGEVRLGTARVLLIDDYGHHPTEIQATLDAIRAGWPGRRIVVAFQPHRYTRTRDLFEDFVNVLSDTDLLVLLEVYAAGETPIAGADGRSLSRAIRLRGKTEPVFVTKPQELPGVLSGVVEDGDVVLVLGAGSIGQIVSRLSTGALRVVNR